MEVRSDPLPLRALMQYAMALVSTRGAGGAERNIDVREESRTFLHDLLTTPSPSGFERQNARIWRSYLDSVGDSVEVDVQGNSFVEVRGSGGPRIALTAHMDEIGLMVTRVGEDGLLRFRPIGGIHVETLPGQAVDIIPQQAGGEFRIPGVIGWNAYGRTAKGAPTIGELTIDIGAEDGPDARAYVRPGDPCVFASTPRYLQGDRLAARGLDDRIGAFVVAEVLRRYAANRGAATLCGVALTMEEIGCYGAATAAYGREFDCAINLDTTYDTILPGVDPDEYGAHGIGKGPVLIVGGMISPVLLGGLREAAEDIEIALQYEACPSRTLTDADALQSNQQGLAHAGVLIVARNVHCPYEVVSMNDVEQTIDLITAFVSSVPVDLDLRRI